MAMRRRFCGVEAANYLLSQYRHIETEEFKRRVAVDPAMQWGCHHWIFARADGLALLSLRRLHVEAEEFERRIAIDPAVPRMRVEQKDVIGLVGDLAVLFAILVVQGHLASAADDVKHVCLFRWSLVKRDQAVGVDVPAHHIDAFADINAVRFHLIECPIVETLVRDAANVRYRRELSRLLLDRNRYFAAGIDFNARKIAGKSRSS